MGKRPLFSIAGIPVRVQPWFFLMIGFLGVLYGRYGWVYVASWMVIATVSILLHEFGHAVAFRTFGLQPSITLHAMGGLTAASTDSAREEFTPTRSIITSLAGPLSALVLLGLPAWIMAKNQGLDIGVVFQPRAVMTDPAEIILGQIIFINVGWSLLNLIPILPLDGGNVMASIGELAAPRSGRRAANIASIALAGAFGLWGLSIGAFIAPAFAAFFIAVNIAELAQGRSEDTSRELAEATRALIAYDPLRAEQLAWGVLTQSPTAEQQRWASELTAWARLARGDIGGAQQALSWITGSPGPSASVNAALALATGRTHEGVATMAWALAHDQHKPPKVLGAMAVAQSGQVGPVTTELLAMGPVGVEAAVLLRDLLDYAGHQADAHQVNDLLTASASRPPGW